jgi:hypothetical protein
MTPRIEAELILVHQKYGDLEVSSEGKWFIVKEWPLPPGWSKPYSRVLVLIPPGYPPTPPDNFYTDNDLRLANGGLPTNTSANQVKEGQQWLQFSYHADPATWRPHADVTKGHNLLTFLEGVWGRFLEAN